MSTLYSLISTSFSWHCRLANAQAHIFYMLFVLIHFSEDARKKNLRKKNNKNQTESTFGGKRNLRNDVQQLKHTFGYTNITFFSFSVLFFVLAVERIHAGIFLYIFYANTNTPSKETVKMKTKQQRLLCIIKSNLYSCCHRLAYFFRTLCCFCCCFLLDPQKKNQITTKEKRCCVPSSFVH